MKFGSLKSLLIPAYALGCAFAMTAAANAAELPKIGILFPGPKGPAPSVDAVVKALADLGHKDGQSVTINIRYAEGKFDLLPTLAEDLVAQSPKIIVACGRGGAVCRSPGDKNDPDRERDRRRRSR